MKKWQIQTKNGFILGVLEGNTPRDALNKLAETKGFASFSQWQITLSLPDTFETDNIFRVIIR